MNSSTDRARRRSRTMRPRRTALTVALACCLATTAVAGDPEQQADDAVRLIRDSRQAATPQRAQQMLDQSIGLLEGVIASDSSPELRLRAQRDIVVALGQRGRSRDALAAYGRVLEIDPAVPAYVISAAGDAAAGAREPEMALQLYEQALAADPQNDPAHAGRIFALGDLDRLDEAENILRERLRIADTREDRLRLSLIRAWGGWTDDAAADITVLATAAPDDAELARQQGNLELLRDRPWAAMAALDRALQLAPGYLGASLDRVSVLDRLGRHDEADTALASLAADAGDWAPYRRVADARRHERGPMIDSRLRAGRGGDRQLASGEVRSETTMWSPMFGPQLRAFAAYRRAYADFRGSYLEDERIVGGLRWQHGPLRLQIEADQTRDALVDDGGAAISADWRVNDDWSLAAAAAINAFDLPLRARGAGTTGDRYSLAARYSPSAQRWMRLSVGQIDYSDGNRRQEMGLVGSLRWPLSHRLSLNVTPGLFVGRNRLSDVPYFSPKQDASLDVAASLEHRIHARLGRQHQQKFEAFAGAYDQHGHAPEAIGGLRYEYSFAPSSGRRVFGRIGRDRRAYDGTPEYQTFVELGLQASW